MQLTVWEKALAQPTLYKVKKGKAERYLMSEREVSLQGTIINHGGATNMKRVNSMPVEKQEPEYEFTRLGLAIMDAFEDFGELTVEDIADCVGEPSCVVQAMLDHLEYDGMVNRVTPAKSKPRVRRWLAQNERGAGGSRSQSAAESMSDSGRYCAEDRSEEH